MLEIDALGGLVIRRDGIPVTGFAARKEEALFVYVACSGRSYSREVLADLLWDDRSQGQALSNLRVVLSGLRQRLGSYLVITRQLVGLNPDCAFRLDVREFEAAVKRASTVMANQGRLSKIDATHLEQALALYRGEFLAGFTVRSSQGFEDWMLRERERLNSQAVEALHLLVTNHRLDGAYPAAIAYARRLLELDPLHEETHRQLMTMLGQTGQRSDALAQYATCRRMLAEELGVEPAEETTALYEKMRDGKRTLVSTSLAHPHNLPPQRTPFIGRAQDLAQVGGALATPGCRLLTLVGPGGIGKTRLALQAAADAVSNFRHGAYVVSLDSIPSADFLLSSIAASVGFNFYSQHDLQSQLLSYLRDKEMLIVLDDFAHLLERTDLVSDMLAQAPGIKILVTSLESLNLQEEWVIRVSGLSYPVDQSTPSSDTGDAIQFFEQTARRAQPDFRVNRQNYAAVVRICQLVEGLPLGLELAAIWIRSMTCSQIADSVAHDPDFLTTSLRNVPERHRSLRVVFEHSWQLLSEVERSIFMKLSVFRGSFGREAAEHVAGASFAMLTSLIDKSLLRIGPSGHFTLHELLRRFAASKLREAGQEQQTRNRHLDYFVGLAEALASTSGSDDQTSWVASFEQELDNWRAALDWSIDGLGRATSGLRLAATLWRFWQTGGYTSEGLTYLERLLSRATRRPRNAVWANALAGAAMLALSQGDLAQAEARSTDALGVSRALGCQAESAVALNVLGTVARSRGNYSESSARYDEGLTLARNVEDRSLIGLSLSNQGLVAFYQQDYERSARLLEKALTIYQTTHSSFDTAFVLNLLGRVAQHQMDYGRAKKLCCMALELCWEQSNRWGVIIGLSTLAGVCQAQGESERAARLLGVEDALRAAVHSTLPPGIRTHHAGTLNALRTQMDGVSFVTAWSEGRAMTLEQAVAYALDELK